MWKIGDTFLAKRNHDGAITIGRKYKVTRISDYLEVCLLFFIGDDSNSYSVSTLDKIEKVIPKQLITEVDFLDAFQNNFKYD